jgi:hypothetical protein
MPQKTCTALSPIEHPPGRSFIRFAFPRVPPLDGPPQETRHIPEGHRPRMRPPHCALTMHFIHLPPPRPLCPFYPCPSVSVRVRQCRSVWVRVGPCGSVSVRVRPCGSVWVRVRPCPSVWVRVGPCPSVSVRVRPCPSVSVRVRPCGSVSVRVGPCGSVSVRAPRLLTGSFRCSPWTLLWV